MVRFFMCLQAEQAQPLRGGWVTRVGRETCARVMGAGDPAESHVSYDLLYKW